MENNALEDLNKTVEKSKEFNYNYCLNLLKNKETEQGLKIEKSLIPNANNGVFALKEFKKKDIVCEYTGRIKRISSNFSYDDKNYFMWLEKQRDKVLVIDGDPYDYPSEVGFASFINHLLDSNVEFRRYEDLFPILSEFDEKRIFVVAKRKINPNEELYVNYGKDYII